MGIRNHLEWVFTQSCSEGWSFCIALEGGERREPAEEQKTLSRQIVLNVGNPKKLQEEASVAGFMDGAGEESGAGCYSAYGRLW